MIRQVFIGRGPGVTVTDALERKLYIIRKSSGHAIQALKLAHGKEFYVPSMSARTIVYKGMLLANQVGNYYKDLQDPRFVSALALVHQRFSTNTFPTWDLAHPFRMIAHNGEINTLRGNVNWIRARQGAISSPSFGKDLDKIWPLDLRRPVGFGVFRQRVRAARHGRLLDRPRDDDDYPGGLGEAHGDGREPARVLRISRRDDGAVGRARGYRLYRRPPDRRDTRSQRPAPCALHCYR